MNILNWIPYIDINIKQFSKFLNDNNNDYQFIFYANKIKEKDK